MQVAQWISTLNRLFSVHDSPGKERKTHLDTPERSYNEISMKGQQIPAQLLEVNRTQESSKQQLSLVPSITTSAIFHHKHRTFGYIIKSIFLFERDSSHTEMANL